MIGRSSGTTFSRTLSMPIGCTRSVVSSGLGAESVTACEVLPGRTALQLRGSASAGSKSGSTGFCGSIAGVLSPQVRSSDTLTEKNRMSDRGVAVQVPRARTGQQSVDVKTAQRLPFKRDVEARREVELERERRHDDEHVEAEVAVNGEACGRSVGFDVGAELHRVRGDGEIAVGADARIVAVADAHAEPVHGGDVEPGGVEVRIESAEREDEVGIVAPVQAQREIAASE